MATSTRPGSIYRKLRVVVEIAYSSKAETVSALVNDVEAAQPEDFLTERYNPTIDEFEPQVSLRSIKRSVKLSLGLGLIDEDGHLTRLGKRALHPADYDRALARGVRACFARHGIRPQDLQAIIDTRITGRPVQLTGARDLWEAVDVSIPLRDFTTYLSLLSQVGGVEMSQRRVFLRFP